MSKLNLTAAFPGVEPLPQADLTRIRIGGRQVNEYLGVEFRRTLGAQRARLDRPRLQVRLLEAGEAASRDGAAAASGIVDPENRMSGPSLPLRIRVSAQFDSKSPVAIVAGVHVSALFLKASGEEVL